MFDKQTFLEELGNVNPPTLAIPDEMPHNADFNYGNSMKSLKYKELCNGLGMYAHVSWNWVKPLARWTRDRKCLEVMAGAGWLSHALKKLDVSIISTDDFSWQKLKKWNPVTDVEQLTANKAIRKYGVQVDIVIMAWPYMDDDAYQALKLLKLVNPEALMVYIGEGDGGCTASERFFMHWETIEDDGIKEAQAKYQQFFGMHDQIELGRYRK